MLKSGWWIDFIAGIAKAQFLQEMPRRVILRVVPGKECADAKSSIHRDGAGTWVIVWQYAPSAGNFWNSG
jgi:hypothetical protein